MVMQLVDVRIHLKLKAMEHRIRLLGLSSYFQTLLNENKNVKGQISMRIAISEPFKLVTIPDIRMQ